MALFEYFSQQLPAARPTAPTSLEPSDETKSPTHGRDNRQAPAVQQYVTSSIVSCETTNVAAQELMTMFGDLHLFGIQT